MSQSSSQQRAVVILNPGDGTGLNFCRSLRLAGSWRTIAVATSRDDFHSSEADHRVLVEWSSPHDLVACVNEVVRAESAALVYVADTGPELAALSTARGHIDAPMLLPDPRDLEVMEDKWTSWEHLSSAGLAVPDTVVVGGPNDLTALFERHERVWLRRRRGSAGAGSIATSDQRFAAAWIEEQGGWGEFTAAECLSARTATFSGLWHDGELVRSQLRERLGWKHGYLSASGVTGITGAQKTVWDEALHELAVRCVLACAVRPHGAIGVDFTYRVDGIPLPTEVQPARFYSSIHFLTVAGLNLPDAYCTLALDGRVALGPAVHNPIRSEHYWVKSVDMLPQFLTQDEFLV